MEMEVSPDSKGRIDGPLSSASRMKKSETKDSMSSVDSDVSLSFDGRSSRSDEADSSDYDSEVRFPERIDIDRDSGADSSNEPKLADVSSDGSPRMESAVSTVSTVERTTTNDELAERICAQVEYYFSDENIAKDAFLLKHVRRNKEGYVSLKLISSFKKVKHFSRDWRVVGAALSRSNKLEVNSQGTKLRRVNPLPSFDQTAPSRTVVAAGLPTERLTVESVAEIFKPCGEIALIRVLKSGRPIPPEVRQAIAKTPELASVEEYAMIEFMDSVSARIAVQMAQGDAKVFELRHSADKKRKHQPTKKRSPNGVTREDNPNSSSRPGGSEAEDGRVRFRRNFQGCPMYHVHNTNYAFQESPSADARLSRKLSSCSISSSENGSTFRRLSSCSGSSSDSGRRYSTCSSSSETGLFYPRNNFCQHENRYSCCFAIGSWMECRNRRGSADYGALSRRLSTYGRENVFRRSRSNNSIAITHIPENVTRMPSGPDDTRGFVGRFARATSVKTT